MHRLTTLVLLCSICLALAGCKEKQTAVPAADVAASPQAAPQTAAIPAPSAAAQTAASPAPTIQITGKNVTPLDQIPERVKRPLTLEEINKLPPEVRDMILRAQGRLPASPAPAATPVKK